MKTQKHIIISILLAFTLQFKPVAAFQNNPEKLLGLMRENIGKTAYEGLVKVEISRNDRKMFFQKQVKMDKDRKYQEEIKLNENQLNRYNKSRKEMKNRRNPQRGMRNMKFQNDRFKIVREPMNSIARTRLNYPLLSKNYNIEMKDGGTILTIETHLLSIMPKYEHRHGNKMWIDKESGLILKRELYSPRDLETPFYSQEFVKVEIHGEIAGSEDTAERRKGNRGGSQVYKSKDELPDNIKVMLILPERLPEGFVLDAIRLNNRRKNAIHQIYTDGLLMFSVFQIRDNGSGDNFERNQRMQNRNTDRNTPLYKKYQDNSFIIIGEINRNILQQVADALPGK